jgi:regulatory protein
MTAYNRAIECLARAPRSTKDLTRWLLEREYSVEDVAAAIEKLTVRGLLNDAQFALLFTRSRMTNRGQSRLRVQLELAKRGIARDLVDAALTEVMTDESFDERAMVEAAAAKKFRSLAKLEPEVQKRRLYGFLTRKGYPSALVRDAVSKCTKVALAPE